MKTFTALHADDSLISFDQNSSDAIFSCNEKVILFMDPNNINLDNTNYDEDDPETIIHARVLTWHIKFVNTKLLKTN